MIAVDTYYAASTICRTASAMLRPYAPLALPAWLQPAVTVVLPEPDQLARLLESSVPASHPRTPHLESLGQRWVQPGLFEVAGVGSNG